MKNVRQICNFTKVRTRFAFILLFIFPGAKFFPKFSLNAALSENIKDCQYNSTDQCTISLHFCAALVIAPNAACVNVPAPFCT